MGIPLVTFGVGGIGEYIEMGTEESVVEQLDIGYIVAKNAVLLHIPSPTVLADAVMMLVNNTSLRMALGQQGRRTVEVYFSLDRQLRQYSDLYRELRSW